MHRRTGMGRMDYVLVDPLGMAGFIRSRPPSAARRDREKPPSDAGLTAFGFSVRLGGEARRNARRSPCRPTVTRGALIRFLAMSKRSFRLRVPFLLAILLSFDHLGAQEAVVRTEENLRAEPNGTILGRLAPGTRLAVEGQQGNWTRVTLEGFVWARSLQIRRDGGFDLVVSVSGGENFRDAPSGRIGARLETGTRLEELDRVPGWIRVRRTAWVWTPSLDVEERAEATERGSGGDETGDGDAPVRDRWVRDTDGVPAILSAPDGDTLGSVRSVSDLRIIGREGSWARVQLEGWVWLPGGEAVEGTEDAVVEGLRPLDLTSDPERYVGRVVQLELQFISVERAERVRTDFYEGEPYLLTRSVDGERTFVYVAVPAADLEDMERFTPLETLRVVGRVRSGAAELTGNPVLDMLEVERVRR